MGFVQGVEENPADRAIVKATCTLGRDLGITVIGEGVETQGKLEFLRKYGCRNIQGYLLARPHAELDTFGQKRPPWDTSG